MARTEDATIRSTVTRERFCEFVLAFSFNPCAPSIAQFHYHPETDSLYIDLTSRTSVESREVAEGVVVDFGEKGNIVGIDIEHASQRLDLGSLETQALPAATVKPAS